MEARDTRPSARESSPQPLSQGSPKGEGLEGCPDLFFSSRGRQSAKADLIPSASCLVLLGQGLAELAIPRDGSGVRCGETGYAPSVGDREPALEAVAAT